MQINVVDSEGNVTETWEVDDEIGEILDEIATAEGITPDEVLERAITDFIRRNVYEDEHKEEL